MSNDVLVTGNLTVQGNVTITPSSDITIKCAILSDTKTAGTHGGTSSVGWQDRTLNTLLDPSNIITLDAGSVLFNFEETGTYYVEGSASAYRGTDHQLCLTDSGNTVAIKGLSTISTPTSSIVSSRSYVQGILTVTSTATDYKLRHYITTGLVTSGLGLATNTAGMDEVYSMISAYKISV